MGAGGSTLVEDIVHYVLNAVDKKDLQHLLSKDEEWERFVADTELSREDAKAVREGLKNQKTATGTEFKEMPGHRQEYKERFLKLYPQIKYEVKKLILQLRDLADREDQVHRGTTISYLVANTTGLVSSILSIVGAGLAPITAGVSLALTATGLGLGVVAAATTATTSIVEQVEMSSIEDKVKSLKSVGLNYGEIFLELLKNSSTRIGSAFSSYDIRSRVARHIRAMRSAHYQGLSGQITAERNSLVQRVFGDGIFRGMTRGDKICFGATAGFSLLVDICSIVHESKDLLSGAKTESAERLRQRAQALETLLEQFKEVYERLQ